MLRIVEDKVGRHCFLLTPCSKDTFKIIPFGVDPDQIPAFNCFMNVVIRPSTGVFTVGGSPQPGGDFMRFRAEMDLVVGVNACSALQSNNYAFKPIAYLVN